MALARVGLVCLGVIAGEPRDLEAERDGIYHPALFNDRLLLGLKDWYRLIDIAGLTDTLIGDADG